MKTDPRKFRLARSHLRKTAIRWTAMAAALGVLTACQGGLDDIFPKAEKPIPAHLITKMKAQGMKPESPILMRIFKIENELEVWKQRDSGRYALLATYEICKWSGKLGPKFKEGDRQAPEGFYQVANHQMNPRSQYHLSFNLGFPNRFDRSHGRTGSHLMVHGACSSAGCYSMEDDQIEEIYALARDALKGGQDAFQVQAYPFRMTAQNMAKYATHEHFEFWKTLKEGYDHFEITQYPPKVDVCEKRYLFNREAEDGAAFKASAECPPVTMPQRLLSAYKERLAEEQAEFAKVLQRQKLRNQSRNELWAALDPQTVSLLAAGSNPLPPPTPEPEPEAPEQEVAEQVQVAETAPEGTPGEDAAADGAVESSTETEAVATTIVDDEEAQAPGQPTSAATTQGDETLSARAAQTNQLADRAQSQSRVVTVRAIPVPQQAPR